MPLYEYKCDACGIRFEKIVKFSDPPLEVCPTCGGTIQKLFSSPAILFKGSGFYINDYAKKPSGDSAGNKAASEKSSDAASEKSSDTTSEKSSETSKSDSSTTPAAPAATAAKE